MIPEGFDGGTLLGGAAPEPNWFSG